MDYETALSLKPSIVGRVCDSLPGLLALAAEKLQVEGEIDRVLDNPEYGQTEIWENCNPR